MSATFWSVNELDLDDSLNCEIWSESPAVQEQIQPYTANWQLGDIGAQQAMRYPHRLPWVPDPVGRDWKSPEALFVFGSAYGPFICGDNQMHELRPADYLQASSAEFLRHFLRSVIANRLYYKKIGELASSVIPSCRLLVPLDLCRAAFVRGDSPRDVGGDRIVRSAPALFYAYTESRIPTNWLWQRLVDSEASAIVALGTVAEHGLLRIFVRHLRNCSICDSHDPAIRFSARENDIRWPSRYAHDSRKLKARKEEAKPPFWIIEGETAGGSRRSLSARPTSWPGRNLRNGAGTFLSNKMRTASVLFGVG